MDANNRLRIATRIHFGLLRHLGEGVDVARMLRNGPEAREVLWVCEASGDRELMALAQQFVRANAAEAELQASAAARHVVQDTPWSRDTSGFGVSQPPDIGEPRTQSKGNAVSSAWLKPVSWLRGSPRGAR